MKKVAGKVLFEVDGGGRGKAQPLDPNARIVGILIGKYQFFGR